MLLRNQMYNNKSVSNSFNFSCVDDCGEWSWDVKSNNVPGLGNKYYISNISTPFGLYIKSGMDIPEKIIKSMYESLTSMKDQFSPILSLISTDFNHISVVENAPECVLPPITIRNEGAFSSSLSSVITKNVPWISVDPSSINGLSKNETSEINITIKPSLLNSTGGPYEGKVIIQNKDDQSNFVEVKYLVNVFPQAYISAQPECIELTWFKSNNVSGGVSSLILSNLGPPNSISKISVIKTECVEWFEFSPQKSGDITQGSSFSVNFSVVPSKVPSLPGTYSTRVLINSTDSSNGNFYIPVKLNVV
jgi:hypothetical protein